MIIRRKFSGYRKMFMNFALQIGHIQPVAIEGLLPEFAAEFEVMFSDTGEAGQVLNANVQQMIVRFKDSLQEGFKIYLDPQGVWLTGEVWPNGSQMKQLAEIGALLTRS